jgi:hypothetical protein
MALVTVNRVGTTPPQFQKNIEFLFISVRDGLETIAMETRNHMRQIIKDKTWRTGSTGNLINHINAYPIPDGWGVGSIDELNHFAPYWYLMNYGGMSVAAARGITLYGNFDGQRPESRFTGSNPGAGPARFYETNPKWPMKPQMPVTGKNYIEMTANWSSTIFRVHFSGRLNRTTIFRK